MPLPKTKSKPKTDLGEFTILVYGPSKCGKSTLASHFPDACFMATEPGLNALEVYKDEVSSWPAFLDNCKEISAGKHNFKTIIIDTVDNLYKFCSDHVCKELGIKHESDLGYGKGFSMVNNEFQRIITKLSLLPYGLVFISHSKEKEIDTRTGKIKKIVPTLPDAARQIVIGLVDIILYCDIDPIKDDSGKTTGFKRVMRTKPNTYYEAGDRTKRLPEVIDMNYESLVEAFKE